MIDLQQIRDQSEAGAAVSGDIAPPNARSKSDDTRPSTPSAPGPAVARPQRTLKTMLFADFAGYSRLHDEFAPLFQQRFLEIGARQMEATTVKPLEAKTWGDSLYMVFDSPREGAEFALGFLASMLSVDWRATGLPAHFRMARNNGWISACCWRRSRSSCWWTSRSPV